MWLTLLALWLRCAPEPWNGSRHCCEYIGWRGARQASCKPVLGFSHSHLLPTHTMDPHLLLGSKGRCAPAVCGLQRVGQKYNCFLVSMVQALWHSRFEGWGSPCLDHKIEDAVRIPSQHPVSGTMWAILELLGCACLIWHQADSMIPHPTCPTHLNKKSRQYRACHLHHLANDICFFPLDYLQT